MTNNNQQNDTNKNKDRKTTVSESDVRPSIALHMIRHAESGNNEVYRNARYIYRGGTPEFDEEGWKHYVASHRKVTGQRVVPMLIVTLYYFLLPNAHYS